MPRNGGNPMSKKVKDFRPKVISFPMTLHRLNIAAEQNILWACHAFNITIPQKKKNALNVFEETILKITEIESGNTDKLANIICVDKELVKFIQNRLNQLGLLSDRYELSAEGKKLLGSWRDNGEASVEYIAGTVFVELCTGKVLSYIHMDTIRHEKITMISGESAIKFTKGTVGKSKEIHGKIIRSLEKYHSVIPNSNDIIKAIRGFKKKYKQHALLNQDVDQFPPLVPMAESITINDSPELIYLHCQAIIQVGNSDLLVTDGCGIGFSESFANHLTFQNLKWVTDLKQKGVVERTNNIEISNNQSSKKIFKYAEISERIVVSKNSLQKIKKLEVNSTYYESDYKQEIEKGIKNLYAALEWSLRQVVADNPVYEWEQLFSAGNFQDNEKLLVGFAQKVGFTVHEQNKSILQVKPGAIRQIERGKVELQSLLALAIAGANSKANHPIHGLAQDHSGFLTHVLGLKRYRDPIEHGSTEKLNIDDKILKELIESTVPMIISLLPGIARDLSENNMFDSTVDINQERLKATVKLEKALGTAFVSSLNGDMKEQLIRSELMLAQFTEEKTIEIIKCYASVMQHFLFDTVNDRRLEKEKRDTIRELAIEKMVQSGFFSAIDNVPKQLSTVAHHNIMRAVQGSSTTLGAHLLAVFLLGSEIELLQLQKSNPRFIDFVANLIRLRGHGNQQQFDISRDDIEVLKNDVFKAIKMIKEIF